MPLLEVSHIRKSFQGELYIDDVSLGLDAGHILCLLGPSGCGKTTLLRIIAGLEQPDAGRVMFDGRDVSELRPHLRRFGMMFQEFALFPHKNVFDNVAFGLEMQGQSPGEIGRRTEAALNLVGLGGFGRRNVHELSGGERQRVALARSLAPQPRLLMLDEPLGALDRALRERLILDIRRILKTVGMTAIFVTHDHSEAFAVADRVAVLNEGRVEQIDSPERLYARPANATVARFLGFHNILDGRATETGIDTAVGLLHPAYGGFRIGEPVTVLLRPEAARLLHGDTSAAEGETVVAGVIQERLFQGRTYQVCLETEAGLLLSFDLPADSPPPLPGQPARMALRPAAMVVNPISSPRSTR